MDIAQIILIVVIVVLIIAYPILVSSRNKKERQKLDEQTNSLKRGDKVMTTSGIMGTIVDLHQEGERKIVTIETGMGKNKGFMSIDAYAIYSILNDNFAPVGQETKNEKPENVQTQKNAEVKVEQTKTETKIQNEAAKKDDAKKAKTEKKSKSEEKKESK